MIDIPWDAINKPAIEQFIANKVQESKTLEYKLELPKGTDGAVKEFLADISSFANASGGDILYGIKEARLPDGSKTGKPEEVVGLAGVTGDEMILRLDSMIRDGLAPRPRVQIKAVDGFRRGPVILVRIPKTWHGPHMITKGESRFFSRTNAGKYPLDVQEIRNAFALSESLPEKIRNWRDGRLAKIVAEETPVVAGSVAKIVLHILPISALDVGTSVPFEFLMKEELKLPPLGASPQDYRINIDGFLTFNHSDSRGYCRAYTQLFRTGAIEALNTLLLLPKGSEGRIIPNLTFEKPIVEGVRTYFSLLKELGVAPPIVIMLTLLGVKGYKMFVPSHRYFDSDVQRVDRDTLLIPDVLVDDLDVRAQDVLRPVFDAVWQACGFQGSQNYDEQGEWQGS